MKLCSNCFLFNINTCFAESENIDSSTNSINSLVNETSTIKNSDIESKTLTSSDLSDDPLTPISESKKDEDAI